MLIYIYVYTHMLIYIYRIYIHIHTTVYICYCYKSNATIPSRGSQDAYRSQGDLLQVRFVSPCLLDPMNGLSEHGFSLDKCGKKPEKPGKKLKSPW